MSTEPSGQLPHLLRDTPVSAPSAWLQTRAIVRVIAVILGVAAALWVLHKLEALILLLVLAVFFAYLVAPLVVLVQRVLPWPGRSRAMPNAVAIGVVYLLIFGGVGIAFSFLLPGIGAQMTELGEQAPTYASHVRDRFEHLQHLVNARHFPVGMQDAIDRGVTGTVDAAMSSLTVAAGAVVGMFQYLPWVVLIPILAFFLLKDAKSFRASALMALPGGDLRWRGADFVDEINRTLAAYIRAQLLACLLIGLITTVGFMMIGVPYALVLGIMAGVLEFIPLMGPLVIAVLAAIITSFHSGAAVVAVLAFLGVLRIAQDYVIYPRLIGRGIHLHPLAIILAVLGGAELAGLAGVFLSVPFVAILSVSHRHWLDHRATAAAMASPATVSGVTLRPGD